MVTSCKFYRHALLVSACVLAATLSLGGAQAAPAYAVIYNFEAFSTGGTDGARPAAEVTFDKAGTLYGITIFGGHYNDGIVFGIAANGKYTASARLQRPTTAKRAATNRKAA